MLSLMFIFLSAGLILIGISIPLVRRKVPFNSWFGIRLRNVSGDRETWYDINEKGGRLYLYFGTALALLSVTLYFVPDITIAAYFMILSVFACTGVVVLGLGIMKIGNKIVKENKAKEIRG